MSSLMRPRAGAVDVVETLVSLDAIAASLDAAGVEGQPVDRLFTRLLRDGFALAASDAYRPFPEVADGALAAIAPGLGPADRERVLGAFRRLDAHPDARPALGRLAGSGLPIVALTNGTAATTKALLERNGLDELVTRVISIDEVQTWKPAPAPYLHAASVLGVEPHRLALVAAHAWDVHGAHRAGLLSGWVSRFEGAYPATFDPPDITAPDLVEVADQLLALPKEA
jgi:2-haloacid dehalogenase